MWSQTARLGPGNIGNLRRPPGAVYLFCNRHLERLYAAFLTERADTGLLLNPRENMINRERAASIGKTPLIRQAFGFFHVDTSCFLVERQIPLRTQSLCNKSNRFLRIG